MTTPSVWSSVALATWSAAMLPEAPGLLSMITGWPSARLSGSASVRAAMSGVEPPGKPTRMRTGFVGQAAGVAAMAECAQAARNTAVNAVENKAAKGFITVPGVLKTSLEQFGRLDAVVHPLQARKARTFGAALEHLVAK